jgi:hypothetical protein
MVKHLRYKQRLCGNYFGLQIMLLLECECMMDNREAVCALDKEYDLISSCSPFEGTAIYNDALWLPGNWVCLKTYLYILP